MKKKEKWKERSYLEKTENSMVAKALKNGFEEEVAEHMTSWSQGFPGSGMFSLSLDSAFLCPRTFLTKESLST